MVWWFLLMKRKKNKYKYIEITKLYGKLLSCFNSHHFFEIAIIKMFKTTESHKSLSCLLKDKLIAISFALSIHSPPSKHPSLISQSIYLKPCSSLHQPLLLSIFAGTTSSLGLILVPHKAHVLTVLIWIFYFNFITSKTKLLISPKLFPLEDYTIQFISGFDSAFVQVRNLKSYP